MEKRFSTELLVSCFGKSIRELLDVDASENKMSFNRFRTDEGAQVMRIKTLLTVTNRKQVVIRPVIGSMAYDLCTQGTKRVNDYYSYQLMDGKEPTAQGMAAINAIIAYYRNKISYEYIVNGTCITPADKLIEDIRERIASANNESATNYIDARYSNVKPIGHGGKGRKLTPKK